MKLEGMVMARYECIGIMAGWSSFLICYGVSQFKIRHIDTLSMSLAGLFLYNSYVKIEIICQYLT